MGVYSEVKPSEARTWIRKVKHVAVKVKVCGRYKSDIKNCFVTKTAARALIKDVSRVCIWVDEFQVVMVIGTT